LLNSHRTRIELRDVHDKEQYFKLSGNCKQRTRLKPLIHESLSQPACILQKRIVGLEVRWVDSLARPAF